MVEAVTYVMFDWTAGHVLTHEVRQQETFHQYAGTRSRYSTELSAVFGQFTSSSSVLISTVWTW